MKAERRHELAENELAKVIKGAPTFWQQSGGKFLLGLIVVLLIIVLIQYRIRSNREGLAQAKEQLSLARQFIEQMQNDAAQMIWMFAPPQDVVARRKQAISEATNALDSVLRLSDDRRMQAEAMLARGDLNWTAASLPDVPGAATQPALQMKSRREYLANAAEAYQTIINSFSDAPYADMAARFGLAAVHEERGEWDAAERMYKSITADASKMQSYKDLAETRLAILPTLRQPVIFGKPTTEPAMPTLAGATATTQMAIPPLIAAPTTATTQAAAAAALVPDAKPQATTAGAATEATTRP